MLPLNFNHLYYFYIVARKGSFSEAARELRVSQSSISVQIRQFEANLGHRLFNRLKTGVELTDSGQVVFQYADEFFHDVDRIWNDLEAMERRVSGTISIGTINSFGIYTLPDLLKQFKDLYPEVRAEIEPGSAREVIEMVQTGKTDIAIVTANRKYSGLTSIPLEDTKMFLVAPRGHPLASGEPVPPRRLEDHPFIGYEEGMETRMMMDAYFRRMSLSIEYMLESSNVATVKHMVMAGLGMSMLPETAIGAEIRDGRLVRIDVQGLYMVQKITLYYKTARKLSPTRREFLKFIQREMGADRELGAGRRSKR
ncbi:MAG: LysR family transcriptional regulator [Candidatus Latescibacterota bacterium]|nr:MAG: LysR family transcriptional regulator [Candidatus Latescibacterota bacterium]